MADNKSSRPRSQSPSSRDDRLKAALKANLGRRKAQAKARSAESAKDEEQNGDKAER